MGKRIRVMHVAQAAGGVERYLQALFRYLPEEDFETILVCSREYGTEEFGCVCEKLEMSRAIGAGDIKAARAIRKLIREYRPDIIYAHSSKAGALARMADLGIRNHLVYNPHGWAFNMRVSAKKQRMYAALERLMARFCDRIVCISEAERLSALQHHICSDEKLCVITNGIDIPAYRERETPVSRQELGIGGDSFLLGTVGRLCEQKAPDILLQAAAQLRERIPDVQVLFVGDGEQREQILSLASEYGLTERCRVTGWVDNPMDYVKLFDVALLLSRWEGFGLVLPEYMLAGKPIVATKTDAIPGIITDHVNGLLVPVDVPQAVCEAVLELYEDRELIQRLIEQGLRDVCEKYDVKRVAAQHAELFRSLMENEEAGV